jgi:hypothetical protein
MTYTSGQLIQATDYNGFVGPTASGGTANANLNDIWGAGTTDKGWGQTALTNVTANSSIVTATQWSGLVNTLAAAGNQTNTVLTSRTAPVATNTISVLANVNADLTSVTTNRGNAAASGTTSSTWTGAIAKLTATGSGATAWTITFTQTVTFGSADQARYFWNAGGLVTLDMSFTANAVDNDPDWTRLVGYMGKLTMAGRVNGAAQTVAATSYTGFNRGGTGGTQTTLASTTGWYSLTAGAAATTMIQINDATYLYTSNFIRTTAAVDATRTVLTLVTTWNAPAKTGWGQVNNISGGTTTASPFTVFGTGPAVLCRVVPPSTTYLTNTWGTPVVASSVV